MQTSLFLEHHKNGLAFYINGDLQFDTADEFIYHEYLVIPAIALAVQRFFPDKLRGLELENRNLTHLSCQGREAGCENQGLRVLICGGGDGLAVRDVLRFPEVSCVDLVDYNPEVLNLARTVFKPYNNGSLESDIVTVYAQEAFEFVTQIPDNSYHVIICDFTYPTQPEDASIYSREWFQQIHRILHPGGTISTNGVSPENRTSGFWCLYQTMLSAGLKTKPLQVAIPSFRRNGYGNWGFFLASPIRITLDELEAIELPNNLRSLSSEHLREAFIFNDKIANARHGITIHTLDCPQLFYYLLNPSPLATETDDALTTVNFIEIQESGNGRVGTRDLLQLESMAKAWIEQLYESSNTQQTNLDISKLLPVQHRYHSPKMAKAWLSYIKPLLAEIDLPRLLNNLLERSQELPPKVARELKQLANQVRSGEILSNLPTSTSDLVILVSVILLLANLTNPDSVFAKGYYGSSSSSSSSSSVDYTPMTATQSTGLMLASLGWGLLIILGLTYIKWRDD